MQYVVYKIACNSLDVDHFYIGSSKNFNNRKSEHKSVSKRKTNTFKLYNTIRAYDGFDNWTMEVIESGTFDTNFEIKSRERFYYDELRPDLNTYRPQASSEEIRIDKLEKAKQYKSQNKDKIKVSERKYRLENKDKLKQYQLQYNERNKEKLKEYRLKNKDKIQRYKLQYNLENKEKIKQNFSSKVQCDICNCECIKHNMIKHNKTKKHLKNLELKNNASKSDL